MTLKAQAETALSNLSSFSQAAQTIAVTDGGQELTAKLTGLDALALAFEHITLGLQRAGRRADRAANKVADALAKRLTYLLEPISPIEVDADQCIVQMRSSPPQRDDNGTRYYEIVGAPRRRVEPAALPTARRRRTPQHIGSDHARSFLAAGGRPFRCGEVRSGRWLRTIGWLY